MKPEEFRQRLAQLDLTQMRFAKLVNVSPRAVNFWATGKRKIPGPVIAYLSLVYGLQIHFRNPGLLQVCLTQSLLPDLPTDTGMSQTPTKEDKEG